MSLFDILYDWDVLLNYILFFLKKNPSCSMGGLEDPYRYTYIASIMFKRQILYYNFIMENMQSNNYSIFQLMFYRQWQERLLLLFISIARLHAFGTTNFKPDFAELVILISSNWLGWIIHAIIGDKCLGVHIRLLIGEFRQNKIFWIISSRTALLVVFMWSWDPNSQKALCSMWQLIDAVCGAYAFSH